MRRDEKVSLGNLRGLRRTGYGMGTDRVREGEVTEKETLEGGEYSGETLGERVLLPLSLPLV